MLSPGLSLLFLRPKPRAAQNGTCTKGAAVPGFGSDGTAQGDSLSPWGAYRGQLWAAPLTWPTIPPWSWRARPWQQTPLVPGTPQAQCRLLDIWNRVPQAALARSPHTCPQRSLGALSHAAVWKICCPTQHPSPRQRGQRARLPPQGQHCQSQPRPCRSVLLPGGPATTSLSSCRGVGRHLGRRVRSPNWPNQLSTPSALRNPGAG